MRASIDIEQATVAFNSPLSIRQQVRQNVGCCLESWLANLPVAGRQGAKYWIIGRLGMRRVWLCGATVRMGNRLCGRIYVSPAISDQQRPPGLQPSWKWSVSLWNNSTLQQSWWRVASLKQGLSHPGSQLSRSLWNKTSTHHLARAEPPRNLQNADIKRFGVGGFLLAPFLAGGNTWFSSQSSRWDKKGAVDDGAELRISLLFVSVSNKACHSFLDSAQVLVEPDLVHCA